MNVDPSDWPTWFDHCRTPPLLRILLNALQASPSLRRRRRAVVLRRTRRIMVACHGEHADGCVIGSCHCTLAFFYTYTTLRRGDDLLPPFLLVRLGTVTTGAMSVCKMASRSFLLVSPNSFSSSVSTFSSSACSSLK